ncbi:hypothetical protein VTN77DRAFT_6973 [Rasamsonia byssochlamydoides]|uniref:uncharacterized protein n=1 Tax=Rasamsonia byssochlamydoides TaxID=89139 RepID=UPI003741EBD5
MDQQKVEEERGLRVVTQAQARGSVVALVGGNKGAIEAVALLALVYWCLRVKLVKLTQAGWIGSVQRVTVQAPGSNGVCCPSLNFLLGKAFAGPAQGKRVQQSFRRAPGLFCHFLFLALAPPWAAPKLLSAPPVQ